MGRILSCLVLPLVAPTLRDEDDADERQRKMLMVPVSIFIALLTFVLLVITLFEGAYIGITSSSYAFSINVIFLIYVYSTKTAPPNVVGWTAVLVGSSAIYGDIWTYGLVDYYTCSVLVIDILLLCKCGDAFRQYVLGATTLVIIVSSVEQTYGLGIYDRIPESFTGFKRPGRSSTNVFSSLILIRLAVFYCDYLMTSHFSHGMRSEKDRVKRSVEVAQRIAVSLATFNLEEATVMLEEGGEGLPVELADALAALLSNLRSYRPYLPQSCLPDAIGGDSLGSADDADKPECIEESIVLSRESCILDHRTNPLCRKVVTLVQLNIRHFLEVAEGLGWAGLVPYHSEYITSVVDAVRATKGLVEHFSGDRVLLSFNAAKLCTSHRLQAMHCTSALLENNPVPLVRSIRRKSEDVIDLVRSWEDNPSREASLSVAVACGELLCGPLGSEGLMSYSLVGATAGWVPILERLCAWYEVQAITDSSLALHMKEHCNLRILGKVVYPKHCLESLAYEFLGMQKMADEEWMYQLEGQQWTKYNTAFKLLAAGKADEAREALEGWEPPPTIEGHYLRLKEKVLRGDTTGVCQVVSDVGVSEGSWGSF